MRLKHRLLTVLMLLLGGVSFGQADLTLYNMQFVPQSMYSNPALLPMAKVNIGLPIISSLYFQAGNTGFAWKDLVAKTPDDSLQLTMDNMISKLKNRNQLTANTAVDLLSFGFRVKKNYFSFNATQKNMVRLGYTHDMMELAWRGNGPFIGETADMSGTDISAMAYWEFGLGYAREINEKLSFGGRFKYLKGILNADLNTETFSLTTDADDFGLTAAFSGTLNTSGVLNLTDSTYSPEPQDFIFGKNSGFALDLGAQYKITEKLRVNASVIDLGAIRWKNNVQNINGTGSFAFDGVDVLGSGIISAGWPPAIDSVALDSLIQLYQDSLSGAWNLDTTNNAYSTWLPTRFHVGANYNLTERVDAGLLFTGQMYKGSFKPALTASINARLLYWLSASLNWSYFNGSASNVGFGLSLNGGPIQLYLASDNILAPILPASTRNAHLHAGLNLTFGKPSKDRDKDGILDKEDECPDEPGLPEFQGCPDRDGDHIPDKNDKCPDVPGVPQFEGCPDTDADGVVDSLDNCVTEPGPVDLAGCPDRDGDKIIDKEDKCPDQPGPKETQGCPDRDRDGVLDMDDACPDKPGDPAHKGCPDTDGDGLYDNEDRCPNEFGPMDNGGCPYGDFDKDGIFDKEDRCPDTPGPRENQGCPWGDQDGDGITDNVDKCPKTPGVPELEGCPKLEEKEQEILDMAFSNLEFESGKAVIRGTSFPSLDSLAALMVKKTDMRLRIAGHTDDVGNDAANMTLSKNRSLAVKNYLNSHGVAEDRFVVEWYGETKPLCKELTPACRQRNRRVEMTPIFE